jgi:hypothetical protein
MSKKNAKVGLSADLFDTGGRPMFGNAVLSFFSDAGVAWSILPVTGGQLPATAFTDYEALLIGGSKVSEKELANESGKLRIIARNGVKKRFMGWQAFFWITGSLLALLPCEHR